MLALPPDSPFGGLLQIFPSSHTEQLVFIHLLSFTSSDLAGPLGAPPYAYFQLSLHTLDWNLPEGPNPPRPRSIPASARLLPAAP